MVAGESNSGVEGNKSEDLRLMAEVFQDIICQVLSGLNGVVNISDDILVFGVSEEEHNKNLKTVLKRFVNVA